MDDFSLSPEFEALETIVLPWFVGILLGSIFENYSLQFSLMFRVYGSNFFFKWSDISL